MVKNLGPGNTFSGQCVRVRQRRVKPTRNIAEKAAAWQLNPVILPSISRIDENICYYFNMFACVLETRNGKTQ